MLMDKEKENSIKFNVLNPRNVLRVLQGNFCPPLLVPHIGWMVTIQKSGLALRAAIVTCTSHACQSPADLMNEFVGLVGSLRE